VPTLKELARVNIDKQLEACGWIVQSHSEMNLYAGRSIEVREFPVEGGSGPRWEAGLRSAFEV